MREWKTITYALNYDVSNYGEVRQNKKNKVLKPYINKQNGYAIHISDLEIFDKPKKLSEFRRKEAPQNFCYVESLK